MEPGDFSNMVSRDIFPQVLLRNLNCSSGMPSNILFLVKLGGAAIYRCRKGRVKHICKQDLCIRFMVYLGVLGLSWVHLYLLLSPSGENPSANDNQGLSSNGSRIEILDIMAHLR